VPVPLGTGRSVEDVDPAGVIAFPRHTTDPARDADRASEAAETALAEIDAAIALVAGRAARRVRITAMPFVEVVAGLGLVHAKAAGMAFTFERPERAGVVTVTIGPVRPEPA
jgi:hypothetical protein